MRLDERALKEARWVARHVQGTMALDGHALTLDSVQRLIWLSYYEIVKDRRKRRRRFNNKKGV
jgi:hypothetical protein